MSYRLRPDRNAAKEVVRVARKRLRKARAALEAPASERAQGVHQARKRFKETRALLRLVRKPLGKHFARDNQRLRDASRSLAASRDATALIESWDALAAANDKLFSSPPVQTVRKRLADRIPSAGNQSEDAAIADVLVAIAALEGDIGSLKLDRSGFSLYADGLERTYRDGRKALKTAIQEPNAHNLHEWRKRVKDHWYHTRLLLLSWPALFKQRSRLLKELSELLGDEHDLFVLCTLIENEPALFGAELTRNQIAFAASQRREELQSAAFTLGHRLYVDSPAVLHKRWARLWKLTRRDGFSSKRASQTFRGSECGVVNPRRNHCLP
ncbi:CHAD domain-containing protein [Pseudomonas saliphila]|uniref:CHAD domain-containing protein n=1 Tax=Pseudomonas saliphila TaxID=2586906 RepID=UPI00123A9D97|nr:CHAD domain-containing protein [Pseudomonas saliphila]